jgi:thiamine biosynthesis lipoprotein
MILRALTAATLLAMVGCARAAEQRFDGRTMGTTYHITVVTNRSTSLDPIRAMVEERLRQINQSMSTYLPDSEISRFNALSEAGKPFPISADFLRVMLIAREVYRHSRGAWDGTVNPLVNLWGFGKDKSRQEPPAESDIQAAKALVGFDQIEVNVNGFLIKKHPLITLDLASIAKGYAADQIAILLRQAGYRDALVEIGGEIYAAGKRQDGKPWRVGIKRPQRDAPPEPFFKVVELSDQAVASSGNYQNYFIHRGTTYSHIIDPLSGWPVSNRVAGASVVADNCGLADGLATALMVMGPQAGIALLNSLEGVAGIVVVQHPDERLESFASRGFDALVR